ncbi:hypothetical protein FPQ18DRAFT_254703 [Pyronema domesticum]|nr:hypothetical protein FPQ18DRAFT_254703 [Pyronema domesticum]
MVFVTAYVTNVTTGNILEKRKWHSAVRCELPVHPDIIAVTPHLDNRGWAHSYDHPCSGGEWCPYACISGKLMNQWNQNSIAYVHPDKEQGGLYCGEDGILQISFPDRDFCIEAPAKLATINLLDKHVFICQTVLPGDEGMRIPNRIEPGQNLGLAVPDWRYWSSTAASYYINIPGYEVEEACVWGNNTVPAGNWAPYVLGLNKREDGEIFATLGWNPIWIEPTTPFREEVPEFGARIICEGVGCHDTQCEINPAVNKANEVSAGANGLIGVGGAAACIVTAPQTAQLRIELF